MGLQPQPNPAVAANKMSLYDRGKDKFIRQPARSFYDWLS